MVRHNFVFYSIILDYNSSDMFHFNLQGHLQDDLLDRWSAQLVMLSTYEILYYKNWLK